MRHISLFFVLYGTLIVAHPVWAIDAKIVSDALQQADDRFLTHHFQAQEFQNNHFVTNWSATTAQGKYRIQTTIRSQGGTPSPYTILFDGQDEFTTIGNSVTITRTASKADSQTNRETSLLPTACFFKGRGLSILRGLKVMPVAHSPLIAVEGSTPNGERIKAVLDPALKYLARRIERLHNSKPSVVIETQGTLAGGLMPRTSRVNLVPLHQIQRFEFQSAQFGPNFKDNFQFVANRPMIIADARFGSPIFIEKKTLKPMTKADIFAITDKQAVKLGAFKKQEQSLENGQKRMNLALTFGPLGAAVLLLCWRSKKRVQPTS